MPERRPVARVPKARRTQAVDAWARTVQRIEDVRVELLNALEELEPWIPEATDAIGAGETMTQLVGRTQLRTRRRLSEALNAMTSALAANRVAAIRVVVDDERLSISDAARLFGIPRQVLSRLYHAAQ
ncbi:MAG: helix-turn-helix domain-containing protein [Actinomycetota bacterium]